MTGCASYLAMLITKDVVVPGAVCVRLAAARLQCTSTTRHVTNCNVPVLLTVLLRNIRLDHLSVCLPVGLQSVLWQNGWLDIHAFGVVSGVSRGMDVLDGGGYCQRGRGSFEGEVGASHCEWGGYRHWCMERSPRASRAGAVSGIFWHFCPIGLNGQNDVLFTQKMYYTRVKSWQYFCTDNTSLESTFHWLSEDVLKFEVNTWVWEQLEQM